MPVRGRLRAHGCPAPADLGEDLSVINAILISERKIQQGIQQGVRKIMRLESQIEELRVLGVVVVLLELHAGVWQVLDFYLQAHLEPCLLDHKPKLADAELFGKLIEDSELPSVCRVADGYFNAADSVANIQEPSSLSSFVVHGQRMANRRLDAEAIKRRAKNAVIIQSIDQEFVHG